MSHANADEQHAAFQAALLLIAILILLVSTIIWLYFCVIKPYQKAQRHHALPASPQPFILSLRELCQRTETPLGPLEQLVRIYERQERGGMRVTPDEVERVMRMDMRSIVRLIEQVRARAEKKALGQEWMSERVDEDFDVGRERRTRREEQSRNRERKARKKGK